ncbi:imidazole glycerol phosphate synthase subunit HisH, partial [Nonomuraea fuscirosea]
MVSKKNVVVLDYGSGNLRSAERALARIGADVTVTSDFAAALDCDGLVVPGVGAFEACMKGLKGVRGEQIVGRRLAGGRPVLGICVGMQSVEQRLGQEPAQQPLGFGRVEGLLRGL